MPQLNINLNPEFEDSLARFMQIRGLKSKSEAVRVAIQEGLERSLAGKTEPDFASWLGLGLGTGQNPSPRFRSDHELWGES